MPSATSVATERELGFLELDATTLRWTSAVVRVQRTASGLGLLAQSSRTPWGNANCARIVNFTGLPVAGICPGDFIVAVNGVPTLHQSFEVAVSLLTAVRETFAPSPCLRQSHQSNRMPQLLLFLFLYSYLLSLRSRSPRPS
jgi:hypothetical protein